MTSKETWECQNLVDHAGLHGRPVPSGEISVPEDIRIDHDKLLWKQGDASHSVRPDKFMLNAFVRLWDQPKSCVLKFAKRWGVLGPPVSTMTWVESLVHPEWLYAFSGVESLDRWRRFSRRAMAVLNLAATLRQGKMGAVEDWQELREPLHLDQDENSGFKLTLAKATSVIEARHIISAEVEDWLNYVHHHTDYGRSDFRIDSTPNGRWELKIDHHGRLLPALAFQIALVVVDADSLYCCSECGKPYIRPKTKRPPNPGRANYCEQCVKLGVPVRRASKRRRERMQEAKALYRHGKTAREIAQELGVKTASVQRWLKATTR